MWDRPALMNAVANALFALAAVLVAGVVLARASQLPVFELREVRVAGAPRHVTREELEAVAGRELRGTFFTIDLARARAAFERLPWVRNVAVRRHWPAGLDVELEEHEPLARWNTAGLVNTHGEVFQGTYEGRLPLFAGPEGAAREISIRYRTFQRSLAAIGEAPVEVQVSARRAWQLKLESGLTLVLGREHIEARLGRFLAAKERAFGALARRIDHVDLRYANGFAVRIPELRHEKAEPPRGRRAG
jgi:cell division protein FtsQ